jgi:hypothetical protein
MMARASAMAFRAAHHTTLYVRQRGLEVVQQAVACTQEFHNMKLLLRRQLLLALQQRRNNSTPAR